ncbi:uncharacterized protein BCR38DRAFT_62477 [Pseudomassariella vexata]|uniref:Uncharacterized protein n=1 Tax=Pseudomassariella vexata TaxID=1141098 RepID=A0A1Y2DKH9_9PEZI|nr:uncharacterized protein BCR38DRAFT_62477 [Pseudomassariella vexata]ORY59743.1 hypothetical protein BCR38DRAFT_62477 [Pseudomassariella vexata]
MTRKLPWKRDGAFVASPSTSSSARLSLTPAANRRPKDEVKSGRESKESLSSAAAIKKPFRRSLHRSASTSPPPEPLQESFMIEGFDEDDQYRMVEDEFFATAQRFTAHLHAAEYQRLKEAAKSSNAATIRDILRPVTMGMTDLVRRKQERKSLLEKQRKATREAKRKAHDSSDEGNSRLHSTALFGLMESPRKQATRLLDDITAISTTTRAAAGFGRPASRSRSSQAQYRSVLDARSTSGPAKTAHKYHIFDVDDDDDDMDASVRRTISTTPRTTRPPVSVPRSTELPAPVATSSATRPVAVKAWTKLPAPLPTTSPAKPAETAVTFQEPEPSDDSDGDIFNVKNRVLQRRARERRAKFTSKTSTTTPANDFIPGF